MILQLFHNNHVNQDLLLLGISKYFRISGKLRSPLELQMKFLEYLKVEMKFNFQLQ